MALAADWFAPQALQRQLEQDIINDITELLHVDLASEEAPLPPSHEKYAMERHMPAKDQNVRTLREFPIDEINERELAKTVADALVIDFGQYTSKHKRIAKAAGAASEKTAENWTQAHNPPSFLHGLRLMAKSPSLAKEIMRLCALEQSMDPTFQRDLLALMQRMRAMEG